MILEKEIMEDLERFELDFRRAISSNFINMKTSDFQHIAAVYQNVFGEKLTPQRMSCGVCRLRALKSLGQAYFDTKTQMEQAEAESEQTEDKPKKKAGRPKKNKTE